MLQPLPFLRKPFRMHELLEQVRKVINGPPAFAVDAVPADAFWAAPRIAALTAALDAARQRYLDAAREFHAVTRDVPAGLPASDGLLLVQRQGDIKRRAFDEYLQARKELEDEIGRR